ncbi:histidine kinase [Herbidospora sp. NBRC 101105]|uniref:sensor histidine kinase n=1 Tax=Herbidospora sp. NBRC 101105 TaxID=3032195 RepID=UPI0024A4E2F8|nr:histidine kinase [Herbidospora sp. NBRC 101105]GLX97250.1 two-component sensor histidine kinase [Herbidospora sp. NBRC 101105]
MPARRDILLAALLTLLAFVPTVSVIGAEIGDLPKRPPDALSVAVTLALTVPLTVRARWPGACLVVVGGAFALHQALALPSTFGTVGLYVALYSAGAHQARRRRTTPIAATAAYVLLAVLLHLLGSPQRIPDFVAFSLVLAVTWTAGAEVRRRRADEAERRRLSAEAAVVAERTRIARELHDVVTHHVTAMVVQADAAQYLLPGAPDRAGESLTAISGTGRRALTELRALLGVLEATGEPAADRTPALGTVGDLVERARLSGQPVEWTEHGHPLARSVDVELAVYRVVQEALTNALKHAAGHLTAVLVRHGDTHIEIEVTTEGPVASGGQGGGRGLAGLRERLRLLGGELAAGPRPGGGFTVRALIPSRSDT